MDKLIAMRSFVEVANTASFTKAADHLNLSRLQVSRHVQELEEWLQQRLLHRTTRKVSLTAAGEDALVRCEQVLNQVADLEVRAQEQSTSLRGSIRVAAPIGFAQNLLLEAITAFTALHPQVMFDVLASDRLSQLVDERVDIALRFTAQPDEQLIARRLMQIDTVVCASPDYVQHHPAIRVPEDLVQHNCFVHLHHATWDFFRQDQHRAVNVSGNITANDMEMLRRAALQHQGVVRLPCDLANPLLREGKLVQLLPEYRCPGSALWAVYLSRSYQTPLVRQFINFIAERWKEDLVAPSTGLQ